MIGSRIQVKGRVQGVFFRVSTKEKAVSLDLTGWVRNESDGSVLIEVFGPEDKVAEFTKWCWIGSPISKVDDVKTEKISLQDFEDFRIVY
ncbi:acylphosphatase [Ekhidna sp. To15]|uniref:acylphosphatase n=1 Tax=Ekhidna sp. To15 TaxID=3395267 RepID=UPI003F5289FA